MNGHHSRTAQEAAAAPPDGSGRSVPGCGRHAADALGPAAVPVAALPGWTTRAWPAVGQHRRDLARPGGPGAVLGGGADVRIRRSGSAEGFDGIEVYAAASQVRRAARDTVARLAACEDQVYVASRTVPVDPSARAGEIETGAAALAGAAAHRLRAIQRADRGLVAALEALDVAKAQVGAADRALRRFHPHGGTLVVTYPTRKLARDRLDRATSTATSRYHLADGATYTLVKEIVAGERAVRAVDHLVAFLLDQAGGAPPRLLRVVRAALPPDQRLDWWRELCSLFAECRPDERRSQAASQLLNAPRTVWTGWTTARGAGAPATEDGHRLAAGGADGNPVRDHPAAESGHGGRTPPG